MFEILLTIGGAIFGALLTAAYERFKDKRSVKNVKILLFQEISSNIIKLREIIKLLHAFPANELPPYIKPVNIEEIASRVEEACHRESFETCRADLPVLGNQIMGDIFRFYDNCQNVPHTFREIERWAGNIRYGLFEDHINSLIFEAENLKSKLAI